MHGPLVGLPFAEEHLVHLLARTEAGVLDVDGLA